jgi:hypothetical protein
LSIRSKAFRAISRSRFLFEEGLAEAQLTEVTLAFLTTLWSSHQIHAELASKEIDVLPAFIHV